MLNNIFDFTSNEKNYCFFQKRTNKLDDIILDGRIEEKKFKVHYPVDFHEKINFLDSVTFGKSRNIIFDKNDNIKLSSLSKISSSYGDILGFDFGWKNIKANDCIILNKNYISNDINEVIESYNNISYKILELNTYTQYNWMVPIPNNMDKNYVKLFFYILNNTNNEGDINIKIGSESIKNNENFENSLEYKDNVIKLDENSINIKNIGVVYINKENKNIFINNDLLLLSIYIEDINKVLKNSVLKLIYLKLEYDVNYLNRM